MSVPCFRKPARHTAVHNPRVPRNPCGGLPRDGPASARHLCRGAESMEWMIHLCRLDKVVPSAEIHEKKGFGIIFSYWSRERMKGEYKFRLFKTLLK